ncbi:MAG: type I DNA topoisomerase [Brevinemataceae bacterium]
MAEKKKTSAKKSSSKKTVKLTKLIIVESPSKATTLKKYLGSGYTVKASAGHVIDLPKSTLGVDTETFEPRYIVMRDRSAVMKDLMEAAKYSSEILLASDPDREGEAIAGHLKKYFEEKLVPKLNRQLPIRRIRFSEITKESILNAVSHPQDITESLVDAQHGRRVIDRLFGYSLSPLLWKKVKGKLSAGRVQSTALRLIVEREQEINNFVSNEFWNLEGVFSSGKHKFTAHLNRFNNKRVVSPADFENKETQCVISSREEMDNILTLLDKKSFSVKEFKTSSSHSKPAAPFITSTLQQAANNLLGWPAAKTMRAAQDLYEGIDIGNSRTGLITYMRTDSTRISPIASKEAAEYITQHYGKQYLPEKPNIFSNKKNSQDAHEAVRPTSVGLHPDQIKEYLSPEQFKLYNLIWRRFVASQMASVERTVDSLTIESEKCMFAASGSRVVFDGYQKVWSFSADKKQAELPPKLEASTVVNCNTLKPEQKFTQPPARYTEASLVKTMEEQGIGRPSTYAPTMSTLTKRYYVKKDAKSLVPTALGAAVNKLLIDNFNSLISPEFTAEMEKKLDAVEESNVNWKTVVRDFYLPFHKTVSDAFERIDSIKGAFDEQTNEICEKCGRPMVKKLGKYGFFLACSGWPECSNAQSVSYGICPKCGHGKIVEKKGKRRGNFYACTGYADSSCDFIINSKPSGKICPHDGTPLFFKSDSKNLISCVKEGCGYSEKYSEE